MGGTPGARRRKPGVSGDGSGPCVVCLLTDGNSTHGEGRESVGHTQSSSCVKEPLGQRKEGHVREQVGTEERISHNPSQKYRTAKLSVLKRAKLGVGWD